MWIQKQIEETNFAGVKELVNPTTMGIFEAVLQGCKNRKSLGTERSNFELMKYAPALMRDMLLNVINLYWTTVHIPEDWQTAKVAHIHKSDRKECDNYRRVSTLNTSYKLY